MSRQFRIEITLEGAAFADAPEFEVARILRSAINDIEVFGLPNSYERSLRDVNGNQVGRMF